MLLLDEVDTLTGDAITDDDLEYVRDLGLVALDDPIRIANPIYAEVVPRVVASRAQRAMHEPTAPYVREGAIGPREADGSVPGVVPGELGALAGALRELRRRDRSCSCTPSCTGW